MSHAENDDHQGGDHHDDHHHEAFDPEPATELAADEPRSPGFLPILGGCLALVSSIYFLADIDAAPDLKAAAVPVPAATAAPAPTAVATGAKPAASGKMPQDPEMRKRMLEDIKRRRDEAQKDGAAPVAPRPARPAAGQ